MKMLYIALLLAFVGGYAQGNPTPRLKSVHMGLSHPDATEWEKLSHPDFDYHSYNMRFDQLKDQPVEFVQGHTNGKGIYVVQVKYMNETYSRHEFPKRKWAKQFKKLARSKQASIGDIIKRNISQL